MKLHFKIIIGAVILIPLGYFIIQVIVMMIVATAIPSPDDVPLNTVVATSLKNDFLAYGKIYEMDDATSCHKSINFESVAISDFSDSNDSICHANRPTLTEILERFEIEKEKYLRFRSRLEESKLRSYCFDENKHVFIVDCYLDNIWGYLYSDEILTVEEPDFYICQGSTIRIVEVLGDNWYRIGGS